MHKTSIRQFARLRPPCMQVPAARKLPLRSGWILLTTLVVAGCNSGDGASAVIMPPLADAGPADTASPIDPQSDGSNTLQTDAAAAALQSDLPVGTPPPTARTVTIAFRGANDDDLGYYLYYGPDRDDMTLLATRVERDDQSIETTRTAQFAIDESFGLNQGNQICFAISSWNATGEDGRSDPACVTLDS